MGSVATGRARFQDIGVNCRPLGAAGPAGTRTTIVIIRTTGATCTFGTIRHHRIKGRRIKADMHLYKPTRRSVYAAGALPAYRTAQAQHPEPVPDTRPMYNEFYGFTCSPFNITPNPRFLYMSPAHREALCHAVFGIIERKGFIVITGEVGAGKTTLCRALLKQLGPQYKTALVLNPCLTETQLLRTVLNELDIKTPRNDRVAMIDTLNEYLIEQVTQGNDVVLIIDEAQDMTFELLEQVRLLSNFETDEQKLLQIVLIGQPELRNKIDHPRMRQLRQRITVRYHVPALAKRDIGEYIRHRLHVSGGNGRPKFEWSAVRRICRYSKGVPRLINAVCDKTLLCGYVDGVDRFTGRHVARAIRELEGKAA